MKQHKFIFIREWRKCKECGKEFQITRYDHIFCCRHCSDVDYQRRNELGRFNPNIKNPLPKSCAICGEEFISKGNNHRYCKFCSDKCRKIHNSKRRMEWDRKNPESVKRRRKRYYLKHRERLLEYGLNWRTIHPSYMSDYYRKLNDGILN